MSDAEPLVQVCYRHPDRKGGVRCQRCDRAICPQCMHQASVGFHCPECTKQGKQKVYTRDTIARLNRPMLTYILVGINVAVYVLGILDDPGGDNPLSLNGYGGFVEQGGLVAEQLNRTTGELIGVAHGEWYRIITSGFLHASPMHILFNMLALWRIGQVLEPAMGRARFGAAYGASLVIGSLGALMLSDPHQYTVGASGAIFGLFGVLFLAHRAAGIDPWQSGIGITIGINLLITFGLSSIISVGGHVGGLFGGVLCGLVVFDVGPKQGWSPKVQVAAMAGLGLVAFAAGVVVAGSRALV